MAAPVCELLVFLKAPWPGTVKTRLADAVGADLAASVYRSLTQAVMSATSPLAASDFRRVVCFAPDHAEAEIAAWFPGEALEPQHGLDLGARMHHAFSSSFGRGTSRAVLIGTDCPALNLSVVQSAFRALDGSDVVIRAALDGGYTLIGLKAAQPALFSQVEWSRSTVLEATLARASLAGLEASVQGPDADIDTADDLRRHFAAIREHLDEPLARRLEAVLAQ